MVNIPLVPFSTRPNDDYYVVIVTRYFSSRQKGGYVGIHTYVTVGRFVGIIFLTALEEFFFVINYVQRPSIETMTG